MENVSLNLQTIFKSDNVLSQQILTYIQKTYEIII